jgi:hypothetical protein
MSVGSIFGGHFGSVENEGGGGSPGTAITQIIAGEGIAVSPTSGLGPVVTVSATGAALWTSDRVRVYAIDAARADNTGAGFADPASTSAGDYAAAVVAAGAVAKKTFAGMAAIWPRIGNNRDVILIIAAADYSAENLEFLNGSTGYRSITVLATGTAASAGVTKFTGTAADSAFAGGITGAGMNAAGYTPAGIIGTSSIQCTKVGGAAPAFGGVPALPLGIRARFDIATTTALLRNINRQICKVPASDVIQLQTVEPATPVAGDTFYTEQPGVKVGSCIFVDLNPGAGVQFVGIDFTGNLFLNSGRAAFAFCLSSVLSFTTTDRISCSQSYTHPVLGSTTPGGGLRVTGSSSGSQSLASFSGLATAGVFSVSNCKSLTWAAGCSAQAITISNQWGRQTDDGSLVPDIGVLSTVATGIPFTWGDSNAGAGAVQINGSNLAIGAMAITGAATAALVPRGRCSIVLVGVVTGAAGNGVGMTLVASALSTIELRNGLGPTVTGTAGDVAMCGGPLWAWTNFNFEEAYDTAGNRIFNGSISSGAQFTTLDPGCALGVNNSGGPIAGYRVVKCINGGASLQFQPADLPSAADPTFGGLYGVLGAAVTNGTAGLVAGFSGAKAIQFDGSQSVGKMAYLSNTPGMATCTPPALRVPLGVVIDTGLPFDLAVVRIGFPSQTPGQLAITLADQFRVRFLSLNPAASPPPRIQFDDLDFGSFSGFGAFGKQANAAASQDTPYASCVKMPGGVLSNDALFVYQGCSLSAQFTAKWHLGGSGYWKGTVAATEIRALMFADSSVAANIRNQMIGVGIFQDVSATKFSFRVARAGVVVSALSTISISTAFHKIEIWSDGSSVFGSVDGETPVLVTAAPGADLPAGNLSQWHANIEGGGDWYLDAVGVCDERSAT